MLMLLYISGQIDWVGVLNKHLSKLTFSLVVDPLHELRSVEVSELTTDHLVGEVMRIKHPVIIDANRNNFDVVLELLHVLERFKEYLNRLVRVLGWWNLAASNPLIVLVYGSDHIVL